MAAAVTAMGFWVVGEVGFGGCSLGILGFFLHKAAHVHGFDQINKSINPRPPNILKFTQVSVSKW